MTLAALSLNTHDAYLTDAEVDALVTIAQNVPTTIETDEDGEERTVYGTTPEADDALAKLTQAFLPLLHKVARTSSVLDEEDALMTCMEEFISVVRRYEVGSALPFKAGLRTVLQRKIGDVGRTSGLIVVKENAAARYRQLMDKHEWNLEAAYADCKAGQFTPDTFLAVHRAVAQPDSLDVTVRANDRTSRVSGDSLSGYSQYEEELADPEPSPEAQTVQAETVRYLFSLVPDEQERIVRLAYGFSVDLATENALMAKTIKVDGTPLSDREIGYGIGMATPTVNRRRNAALKTFREALSEDDAEDTSAA